MCKDGKSYLISVDPGIRGSGIAIFNFNSKKLFSAAYVKNTVLKGHNAEACRAMAQALRAWCYDLGFTRDDFVIKLAVEWPLMLPAGQQKGDQNDLPPLAAVSACFAMSFPSVPCTTYLPREWKHTVEPDVMTRRIHKRLSEDELGHVQWMSKSRDPSCGMMHNAFDAVGIGLKVLGRLEPRKTYAGV